MNIGRAYILCALVAFVYSALAARQPSVKRDLGEAERRWVVVVASVFWPLLVGCVVHVWWTDRERG